MTESFKDHIINQPQEPEEAGNSAQALDYSLIEAAGQKKLWKLQSYDEKGSARCYFAVVDDVEMDPFVIWFSPDEDPYLQEIRINSCGYAWHLLNPSMLKAIVSLSEQAQRKFNAWAKTKAGQRYLNDEDQ